MWQQLTKESYTVPEIRQQISKDYRIDLSLEHERARLDQKIRRFIKRKNLTPIPGGTERKTRYSRADVRTILIGLHYTLTLLSLERKTRETKEKERLRAKAEKKRADTREAIESGEFYEGFESEEEQEEWEFNYRVEKLIEEKVSKIVTEYVLENCITLDREKLKQDVELLAIASERWSDDPYNALPTIEETAAEERLEDYKNYCTVL